MIARARIRRYRYAPASQTRGRNARTANWLKAYARRTNLAISLGIDTGGTYTDAVIFDHQLGVVAKAKSLTTHHDLAIGIAKSVDEVIARANVGASQIELVSLSTTLATNALVEGRGGRVALVFIGFDDDDSNRAGLVTALDGDPLIRVVGGHDSNGDQRAELDLEALLAQVTEVAPLVSGFAVSAYFGTRNPAHEMAARDLIVSLTGLPVTCGHELTAKLDGPRRALTSVLNARLIGLISNLIAAAQDIIAHHQICASLMVVRGDGALMSAAVAKTRPIETILSGPAASVIGAAYLTHLTDALVVDIGGTTTDIAAIRDGLPSLDSDGASVGGFRTMVEAVAITTIGLGGDSEVLVSSVGICPRLVLGPRRVIPLCLAAVEYSGLISSTLDRQLLGDLVSDHDGRFVLSNGEPGTGPTGLSPHETELLSRVPQGGCAVDRLVQSRGDLSRLNTLVRRGFVMLAAFTPTDAAHVLRLDSRFDSSISTWAATLMARKRTALGQQICVDGEDFSNWTIATLQRRSAETLLDVGFGLDGFDRAAAPSDHPLVASSLDKRTGLVDVSVRVTAPLVGLGASAALYYPYVADLLRTTCVVPPDADVANAIGAVVGQVRARYDVYVAQPERGQFRVHHPLAESDSRSVDEALSVARGIARCEATRLAFAEGADVVEVVESQLVNIAHMEGEEYFVDATVTAVASGRPGVTY